MLALRRTVASSAPLVGAYSGLLNGKRKIEKPRPGKLFLIFFSFSKRPRPASRGCYLEYPERTGYAARYKSL